MQDFKLLFKDEVSKTFQYITGGSFVARSFIPNENRNVKKEEPLNF